jgi:hypothetical protein
MLRCNTAAQKAGDISMETAAHVRPRLTVCRTMSSAILAAAVLQWPAAAQVPTPQNPSPMVEATRAHERLTPRQLEGTVRTFTGPAGRDVEVFVPALATADIDLVIHFHGAAWLPQQAVADLNAHADLNRHAAAVVVNLGSVSSAFHRPFADPATFDSLLAGASREISAALGRQARARSITLTAFSAGHGAVRAILLEPRHFAAVDAVLLLDGMHTSYVPENRLLADGGTLDTTNLAAFAEFARAAVRGEKRFLVTHSDIFPGTYASTTETADWLLHGLDLRRTPVLSWGPRGMQQLSEVKAGHFEILGFAGNSAPDHVDQLHALPELLARLWAGKAPASGL